VRREAGEESAGRLPLEPCPREPGRGPDPDCAETRQRERTARRQRRRQRSGQERVRRANEWAYEPPVGTRVGSERCGRVVDGALEEGDRTVLEGMRERRVWMDDLGAVLGERKRPQER
jgi:hypothetical protein